MNLKTAMVYMGMAFIWIGGCDQAASQHATGRKQFQKVLQIFHDAELGYVPATPKTSADQADKSQAQRQLMQDYRQEKLTQALEALKPIIAKGTPDQQVAAMRLASEIHASAARYHLRHLLDQWSALSQRSIVLMSYMVAVGRAHSQLHHLRQDESPLLVSLQKTQRKTTEQLDRQEQQGEKLDVRILKHRSRIKQLKTQIQALKAKAQKLKKQAFVATRSKKWDLLNQTAQVTRQASQLDAQMQLQTAYKEKIQAERTLLTEQTDFTLEFLDALEQQIDQTKKRQAKQVQSRHAALERLQHTQKQFMEELNHLVEHFSTQVKPWFKKTNQQIDMALALMNQAKDKASSEIQDAIAFEILTRQLLKLNIEASIMMITQDMGSKFKLILNRAQQPKAKQLMADRVTFFQSTYDQMVRLQTTTYARTRKILQLAQQQADHILTHLDAESPLGKAATRLKALVETYTQRIENAQLASAD